MLDMWCMSTTWTNVVKWKRPLKSSMQFELFVKWGLGLKWPSKSTSKYIGIQSTIMTTNYIIKWVEVKALQDNTTKSMLKFLYEHIITHFGCPTHLVSDQGSHFTNQTIQYTYSTIYDYSSQIEYSLPTK